jgi:hypothetical protein
MQQIGFTPNKDVQYGSLLAIHRTASIELRLHLPADLRPRDRFYLPGVDFSDPSAKFCGPGRMQGVRR